MLSTVWSCVLYDIYLFCILYYCYLFLLLIIIHSQLLLLPATPHRLPTDANRFSLTFYFILTRVAYAVVYRPPFHVNMSPSCLEWSPHTGHFTRPEHYKFRQTVLKRQLAPPSCRTLHLSLFKLSIRQESVRQTRLWPGNLYAFSTGISTGSGRTLGN